MFNFQKGIIRQKWNKIINPFNIVNIFENENKLTSCAYLAALIGVPPSTRNHLNVKYSSIWCTWPWSPLIMQVNNPLVLLLTNNTWGKVAKFVTSLHLEVPSARNQRRTEYLVSTYSVNGWSQVLDNKTFKFVIKDSFHYFYFLT